MGKNGGEGKRAKKGDDGKALVVARSLTPHGLDLHVHRFFFTGFCLPPFISFLFLISPFKAGISLI